MEQLEYTEQQIAAAKKKGFDNSHGFPRSREGFWFENIYIESIFLDKTGTKELTLEQAVAYYGAENVRKYMRIVTG